MKFNEILSDEKILQSILECGFDHPTEIQEKIIPLIVDGNDVLGQSQTGTGKTLAYGAPVLERVEENGLTQCLILSPTRELAIQISNELKAIEKYKKINITCVYGSSSIEDQIKNIKKGSEIIVGTPGRVKDLIRRKVLKFTNIKFFVLDEADEMLSMGFEDDIETIFKNTNSNIQVMLFSATMPKQILNLAEKYMKKDYKRVSVISNVKTAAHIKQNYYIVNDKTRLESMCRIVDYYNPQKAIIFCRTKRNADDVLDKLSNKGYSVDVIHGDISQSQRITTLDHFKSGLFNILIATDVAARGIHVDDVELVINYNLPESHEAYVHRIGRTGRATKSGIAVSLINPKEEKIIQSIANYINTDILKEELPTIDMISNIRTKDIINKLDTIKVENIVSSFENYLGNLSTEELMNITKSLLEKELSDSLGSDFNCDVKVQTKKEKSKSRNNDDSVRVFLTIGKMDGIEKREFLKFIEKTSKVKEGTCFNVEIMPKFTFMNVKKEEFNKVINSCNDIKYNNRVIHIEKAKK